MSHQTFDHTSILKFVETKWNLPALTYRDANAHNMLDFFDLSAKRPPFAEPPALKAPKNPFSERRRPPRGSITTDGPGDVPHDVHGAARRVASPPSGQTRRRPTTCGGSHRGPAEADPRGDPGPDLDGGAANTGDRHSPAERPAVGYGRRCRSVVRRRRRERKGW